MKVTLCWSDPEGWPQRKQFDSEEEADAYVDENLRDTYEWHNPCPVAIVGPEHEIVEYEGFERW